MKLEDLHIKIYCDGLKDADHLLAMVQKYPFLQGFTTNPTLMRAAGVMNYERWARELLDLTMCPISFEVIADDFREMEQQACALDSWGPNVYVKIPITNTKGESAADTIRRLSHEGIKVNVTAVMTYAQTNVALSALDDKTPSILSIFAGRIADTGENPATILRYVLPTSDSVQLLWASPREVYNVVQAEKAGADIITCSPELLSKLHLLGKPLADYSLDTVKMFYDDACKAGYTL